MSIYASSKFAPLAISYGIRSGPSLTLRPNADSPIKATSRGYSAAWLPPRRSVSARQMSMMKEKGKDAPKPERLLIIPNQSSLF